MLDERATRRPGRRAYVSLRDGTAEEGVLTYGTLRTRAVAVAARLEAMLAPGHRAILIYPQGLEFLVAFLGCLYAGVVAVPVSVPSRKRGLETLVRIALDSGARHIFSTGDLLHHIRADFSNHPALGHLSCVDPEQEGAPPADWAPAAIEPGRLALLQYTSGSTGSPRGVAVTHANLADNNRQIALSFRHDERTRVISWLPMFHDMGLGIALQAAWVGGECVLMSPRAFLQDPRRWLAAISSYRGTTSGAPDFAFDLCARRVDPAEAAALDLSTWKVAFNGSEPVRASTIERFVEVFGPSGFRRESMHPVYGLAEATLFVTSDELEEPPRVERSSVEGLENGEARAPSPGRNQALVSCGHAWGGTEVAIIDPESRVPVTEGRIGEIWIQGDSVAQGYWGKEEESEIAFRASTSDGRGPFLRTGDLGFQREGRLFVTGRLKDLIIIRGRNHYPQDIEESVSTCHPALV
ncbi:MAG: fatty acyl-AMP ligase, partial [Myxococcales bacterium]|nr:fatty acyl-AMP ligase [Myxococcales bacterium]